MPTSKPKASPARTTLFSAQQHREQAEYFRQFPNPKAQRTAELHETEARLIEKRDRGTYAKQQIAEKLALARQNAEQYAALADNPRMSPGAALAARNLARSYKGAMALYEGALAYARIRKTGRAWQSWSKSPVRRSFPETASDF
jgi:hypothetical protein